MREATRSGWNGSSASTFSPTPTNAMGRPVTWRTDSAAPPRESPSILVRTTPSIPTAVLKRSATVRASWPVMASTTRSTWWGLTSALILCSSSSIGLVDVQAAGGVQEERGQAARRRLVARRAADLQRGAPGFDHRDPELSAQRAELVLGGGAVGVGGGEERMLSLLGVHAGQLGRRGGLARALEAHQHDDGGRGGSHGQAMPAAAQELDQLVVDDLDHLLGRRQGFQDVLADRLAPDGVDEGPHDLEVDVGLQEGHADLAQRLLDVVLGEAAPASQPVEDALQSGAQGVEHGNS